MSRVPKKTKLRFMELAVDFEEDYGLCLKALLDEHDSKNYVQEILAARILEIERKLNLFESPSEEEPEEPEIRTLGGKIIKGGKQ